jgi:hypothetical protein
MYKNKRYQYYYIDSNNVVRMNMRNLVCLPNGGEKKLKKEILNLMAVGCIKKLKLIYEYNKPGHRCDLEKIMAEFPPYQCSIWYKP